MAQSFLVTNVQTGNFENLVNFITSVSYELTPFLSTAGKDRAKAILHEWMTEAIRAGATNTQAEGYSPTFAAADITARVRRTNPVQLLAVPFSVSGTQEAVDKAGLGESSEYDHQKDLKFKELAKDLDFELLRGARITRDADAGTASRMDGALAWATGTRSVAAAPSPNTAILSEDLYNQVAQAIYESTGEKADRVFCNGFQKRLITRWATPIRRMADEKQITNAVNVYDGDWGTQTIIHDLHMPTDQILLLPMKMVKVAYLRPVDHTELGVTRDARRGYVLTEATLRVDNPNAIGVITQLAQSA